MRIRDIRQKLSVLSIDIFSHIHQKLFARQDTRHATTATIKHFDFAICGFTANGWVLLSTLTQCGQNISQGMFG
ncbi:Uncharacterised protein [Vibrio cholerae]|uniref:Uncharacterized protein n=1 Tax=Vibrio cholerae TaxID=666 RepID=A0A655PWB5_VIBCL|nr:Uncharacterised protein [Vibrio cholerae]CRZ79706.1 Uncharacterised protein [Vibrio cholerae]CSA28213.1 Uncharacterised protein [Vibrio cholerae]CSA35861.1 Uncharacterised protein [Vibrio cholerae]CSB45461.1 Uncharacterised protein [Vibrio cholerae]